MGGCPDENKVALEVYEWKKWKKSESCWKNSAKLPFTIVHGSILLWFHTTGFQLLSVRLSKEKKQQHHFSKCPEMTCLHSSDH